jgi:hypothetical protein
MERKLMAVAFGSLLLFAAPVIVSAQQQQSSQDQSSQQGDPVVEAARKAREQKKEAPKPKKVYTNDDIKSAQPLPGDQTPPANGAATAQQSSAQGAPQGQASAGGGAQGTADKEKEDPETTWRKRFAAQREKIARAEKELDILQREENKAAVQYYSDPQKALAEQYTRKDINDKAAKIAAKQKEIDDLKQQLSDMEDQLRKSGGDSGWARP